MDIEEKKQKRLQYKKEYNKQYREENKNEILKYQKEYRQKNKEKKENILKQNKDALLQLQYKEYLEKKRLQTHSIICECGKKFKICNKEQHNKSAFHKEYLEKKNQNTNIIYDI